MNLVYLSQTFYTMSSLRNSLHRRNHKERSQLAHRAKFGILEKHKDYVLRARDYHSKRERIKTLRRKAADRNKDEFYFGMVNQRTNVRVSLRMESFVAGLISLRRKVFISRIEEMLLCRSIW